MNQPADTPPDSSKPDRAAETASAFEPRAQAAAPKQFGKSGAELAPASGVGTSDPRFLAAQFQHRVCNAVREWMLARGKTIEVFGGELKAEKVPGAGSDKLGRVLRGETLLQIVDLVALADRVPGVRTILLRERTWTTSAQIRNHHEPDVSPAAVAGVGI